MKLKICLLIMLLIMLSSCATVKGYEKVNLSDPDMELSDRKENKFETSFQIYREGASGANGGKAGGGCGCN
ncbi:TPA: arginine decarboxylase [Candidatus Delongbacteria bacterium]|nr:arginine decarboxylase [Candidatus Delongbacteria bacterium]